MKLSLITIFMSVILFSACKNDDAPTNTPVDTTPKSQLSAKLNGQVWTADSVEMTRYALDTTKWNLRARKGLDFFGDEISFVIKSKDTGTYTVNVNNFMETYITFSQGIQNVLASREGSITITESTDKYVKGTFNFKVHNTNTAQVVHTFTDGTFTARLK